MKLTLDFWERKARQANLTDTEWELVLAQFSEEVSRRLREMR